MRASTSDAIALSQPSSASQTILVLRMGAVGDVVLATPAIDALKHAWPNARIVWAVKQSCAPLLAHNPNVDEVVVLHPKESLWHFAQRLRRMHCMIVLDVHASLRTRMLRVLLGRMPRTVVWHKRPWRDAIPVRLGWRPYRAHKPFAFRMHDAVETLVGRALPKGRLQIHISDAERHAAHDLLLRHHLDPDHPILAIIPGARWATKRWPIDNFIRIAERAVHHGMHVLVTGSANERPMGEAIRARVPQAQLIYDDLPLALLPATLAHCRALIGNDSGPMHIARAMRVPTVGIFGSTDPTMFDFTGHRALRATDVPCAPCHFYGRSACPKTHFNCMHHISADAAWDALIALMAAEPAPWLHA